MDHIRIYFIVVSLCNSSMDWDNITTGYRKRTHFREWVSSRVHSVITSPVWETMPSWESRELNCQQIVSPGIQLLMHLAWGTWTLLSGNMMKSQNGLRSSQDFPPESVWALTKETTMPFLMGTTWKWMDKRLLEKARIWIISHYSGMPGQLAGPIPGTFFASSHLWDSVKWKQRDQPGFQICSNLQFSFSVPRPASGLLHFRDLGLVPEHLKGHLEEVGDKDELLGWPYSKLWQKYLKI